MKKILKLCSAVLTAALIFCLAGCSARTPVSPEEFKKQTEALGYKVSESKDASGDVKQYSSAVKEESETEVVYILFNDENKAQDTYNSIKEGLVTGAKGTSKNVDSASYNKFTYQNGELNHTLVRMNKTVVYGKATLVHKNEMDEVFKKIKY